MVGGGRSHAQHSDLLWISVNAYHLKCHLQKLRFNTECSAPTIAAHAAILHYCEQAKMLPLHFVSP